MEYCYYLWSVFLKIHLLSEYRDNIRASLGSRLLTSLFQWVLDEVCLTSFYYRYCYGRYSSVPNESVHKCPNLVQMFIKIIPSLLRLLMYLIHIHPTCGRNSKSLNIKFFSQNWQWGNDKRAMKEKAKYLKNVFKKNTSFTLCIIIICSNLPSHIFVKKESAKTFAT